MYLYSGRKLISKKRTTRKYKTLNPYFNESFQFKLDQELLEVSFSDCDRPIGVLVDAVIIIHANLFSESAFGY